MNTVAESVIIRDPHEGGASTAQIMADSDIFPVYHQPDWEPLKRILSHVFGTAASDASSAFWFVGFVRGPEAVGELRLYEHSVTHRQLILDRKGKAWRWDDTLAGFVHADEEAALIEALV